MVTRRRVVLVLGVTAFAAPLTCFAQPQPVKSALPVIGLLSGTRLDDREISAVRQGLKETGYTEGHNVVIEYRSAEGQYDRLPTLAADLVHRQVAVIIAIGGTVTALAAKAATPTIPVVFATAGDPVKLGLVSVLSRPGGNLTGATFLATGLGAKRLQLLRELLPTATAIGFLVNPANPNLASETKEVQAAARMLGQQIHVQNASDEREIDAAFARFAEQRANALIVAADAIFTSRREQLVALATRHAMPAIYALPEFVAAGGLASYGASRVEAFHLVGNYTSEILKGKKPTELPVQQSMKVELVINLKTAKALGIKVPRTILIRADEVIE